MISESVKIEIKKMLKNTAIKMLLNLFQKRKFTKKNIYNFCLKLIK